MFFYVRWSSSKENTRRKKLKDEDMIPEEDEELHDKTDKEDLTFVYRL